MVFTIMRWMKKKSNLTNGKEKQLCINAAHMPHDIFLNYIIKKSKNNIRKKKDNNLGEKKGLLLVLKLLIFSIFLSQTKNNKFC